MTTSKKADTEITIELRHNPRLSLVRLSRKTGIPVSSLQAALLRKLQFYKLRGEWVRKEVRA